MATVKLIARPARKTHPKVGRSSVVPAPKAAKATTRKGVRSFQLTAAQKTLYTGIGESGLFSLSNTQNSYEGVVSLRQANAES